LISGLVWPFYSGYVEGAIEGNAPEINRLRGWMYFFSGTLTYAFLTAWVLIATRIPAPSILAGILICSIPIAPLTLSQFFYERLVRWASRVFGYQFTEGDMLSLACTILGGCGLAWASLLLSGFLYITHDVSSVTGEMAFVLTILCCFAVFERTSRLLVANEKFHEAISIGEINSSYYLALGLRVTITRCVLANRFALFLIVAGWIVFFAAVAFASSLETIGQLVADCLIIWAIVRYAKTRVVFTKKALG
jgi:hypothetical protein